MALSPEEIKRFQAIQQSNHEQYVRGVIRAADRKQRSDLHPFFAILLLMIAIPYWAVVGTIKLFVFVSRSIRR